MKWKANDAFANRADVLRVILNFQEYAIVLTLGSELRKRLNEKLLRFREIDAWNEHVYHYLGE
ncbi:hypothetical protein SAMN06265222_1175 [Neorhodopirellula lusitana]|uniref:Uncharacterized protein n=1 Tax=Neorhodopirellula lusitana TaxID=445327 RepID=A0ABY1QJV8_9BACT|nr:hypothetical protein [Neorhodopirellula lusitana]SMP73767.1 hypothetical protein SAMN06265222_1175 [Neorhodopirellula lusitana]